MIELKQERGAQENILNPHLFVASSVRAAGLHPSNISPPVLTLDTSAGGADLIPGSRFCPEFKLCVPHVIL